MKIHLKFNHNSRHTLEALDSPYTIEETNDKLNDVMREFIDDDKYQQKSHLSELIHNEMDYSAILYMATNYIHQKVEEILIKKQLKRFLEEDEDI